MFRGTHHFLEELIKINYNHCQMIHSKMNRSYNFVQFESSKVRHNKYLNNMPKNAIYFESYTKVKLVFIFFYYIKNEPLFIM